MAMKTTFVVQPFELHRKRLRPARQERPDESLLASQIGEPTNRLTKIIRKRRWVTADTTIRLGRRFCTTPQFWINLQAGHELSRAEAEHDYSSVLLAEAV